mgnify:FL=1
MNYYNCCINLRNKKGKPFCKLRKEEITFSCCQGCDKKEYRAKKQKNSFHTINNNKIEKEINSIKKSINKTNKIKNKSNKLSKLEKSRFSVFSNNTKKCYLCGSSYNLTWHEIYAGRNRQNSMKYGLCLRLCLNCHEERQEDINFNEFWHKKGQSLWESEIGSREEFIKVFRRNYL